MSRVTPRHCTCTERTGTNYPRSVRRTWWQKRNTERDRSTINQAISREMGPEQTVPLRPAVKILLLGTVLPWNSGSDRMRSLPTDLTLIIRYNGKQRSFNPADTPCWAFVRQMNGAEKSIFVSSLIHYDKWRENVKRGKKNRGCKDEIKKTSSGWNAGGGGGGRRDETLDYKNESLSSGGERKEGGGRERRTRPPCIHHIVSMETIICFGQLWSKKIHYQFPFATG